MSTSQNKPKAIEVLAELKREKNMRERVYPRWVREGRMKQSTYDLRMHLLNSAISVFEHRAENENEQGKLF